MLTCRLLGHRYGFHAEGHVLVWQCERGCGDGGAKEYSSAADAEKFAAAFDRRDTDDLGRRAPLLGLFPLRLWRWARERERRRQQD